MLHILIYFLSSLTSFIHIHVDTFLEARTWQIQFDKGY